MPGAACREGDAERWLVVVELEVYGERWASRQSLHREQPPNRPPKFLVADVPPGPILRLERFPARCWIGGHKPTIRKLPVNWALIENSRGAAAHS